MRYLLGERDVEGKTYYRRSYVYLNLNGEWVKLETSETSLTYVSARVDQELNHFDIASKDREVQWGRLLELWRETNTGRVVEQKTHNVNVAAEDSVVEDSSVIVTLWKARRVGRYSLFYL